MDGSFPLDVVAISASPRAQGNSNILLSKAIETLRHVLATDLHLERISISDLTIAPCKACEDCFAEGICSQRDDMSRVQTFLEKADLILVASPLYFSGPPGPFKVFIDRCQNIWAAKTLLKHPNPHRAQRRALVILTAARKANGVFAAAEEIIKVWLRTLDVPAHDVVTCPGVDRPGEAALRPGRLQAVDRAVTKLLEEISSARSSSDGNRTI